MIDMEYCPLETISLKWVCLIFLLKWSCIRPLIDEFTTKLLILLRSVYLSQREWDGDLLNVL